MKTRPEPKVVRQEVHWIPDSRRVLLKEFPYRVWTLYSQSDPTAPPALPITPVHLHGAFMEDFVHDWNIDASQDRSFGNYTLRYYSRAMHSSVWVLVEYADHNPFDRKR